MGCDNYIEIGTDLYPVGVCYSTNNDALDLSGYEVGDSTVDQNMMYVCRETTNGTIQAFYSEWMQHAAMLRTNTRICVMIVMEQMISVSVKSVEPQANVR